MQHLLSSWGYLALVLLTFAEAACVPIPSEVTLGYAGYLASTGSSVLVEASSTDLVWGAGVSEEDPFARAPRRWPGKNLLGFALMAARDAIGGGP